MIPIPENIRTRLEVVKADISTLKVDAIVNSARADMTEGGYVDQTINRVAGPQLREACFAYVKKEGRCFAGGACMTPAFNLPCRYVIHAVGPMWCGGDEGEEALLIRAYAKSLEIARVNGLRTIAFASISTGFYRYPKRHAARAAIQLAVQCLEMDPNFKKIIFCVYDDENLKIYEDLIADGCSMAQNAL